MKLFVAPTDFAWYSFFAARQPEEVNFWRPSASADFHALDNGDPLESGHLFQFKLKGNIHRIAGGGFFIGYSRLQLSVAWNIFGEHNGAASFLDFSNSIRAYMATDNARSPDLHIEVSKRLKEDFSNGRDYYAMKGQPLIVLPHQIQDRLGHEFVEWHNKKVFRR